MIKKFLALTLVLVPQLYGNCCDHKRDNGIVPAPVLTSAVNNDGTITVKGKFRSGCNPNSNVIIQFFGNPEDRGVTEGQDYLGQTVVHTNCFGRGSFNVTLAPTQIDDPYISADATVVFCDGRTGSTSEFSENLAIG